MPPPLNEILVMTQKEGNVDIDRCVTKGFIATTCAVHTEGCEGCEGCEGSGGSW